MGRFALGAGYLSCDGCEGSTEFAVDLVLGYFINPKLAVGYEYKGILDSTEAGSVIMGSHTVSGLYWVLPKLWVHAGLGLSQFYVSIDPGGSDSEHGIAFLAGAGYDLVRLGGIVIDASLGFSYLNFDELSTSAQIYSVLVGVAWR
jgi:hypothetical protein